MPRLPFPQSFSMTLPLNHWNTHTHPSFGTTSSPTEHFYCHPRHTSLLFYYSHNNSFSTTHIIISPLSLPHPPQHLFYHHLISLLRYTHNISLSTTPNTTSLPHSTSPSLPHSPHYWFIIIFIILDSPQFYFLLLFLFLFLFLLLTLYFSLFFSPDHALMIVFFPSSSGKRKNPVNEKEIKDIYYQYYSTNLIPRWYEVECSDSHPSVWHSCVCLEEKKYKSILQILNFEFRISNSFVTKFDCESESDLFLI